MKNYDWSSFESRSVEPPKMNTHHIAPTGADPEPDVIESKEDSADET